MKSGTHQPCPPEKLQGFETGGLFPQGAQIFSFILILSIKFEEKPKSAVAALG